MRNRTELHTLAQPQPLPKVRPVLFQRTVAPQRDESTLTVPLRERLDHRSSDRAEDARVLRELGRAVVEVLLEQFGAVIAVSREDDGDAQEIDEFVDGHLCREVLECTGLESGEEPASAADSDDSEEALPETATVTVAVVVVLERQTCLVADG